ncbi:FxsA family protein [Natronoglycomyces albus]|uniref:FxsA family protein n=1 Tax=Natronoglycomyces albus TaxID=2811108 RepID=A0A895XTZ3_9ACTN|nr:FxsA family protein [Natronoglycomyces albus]QSB06769.1 FxsA family protein [Natronoglycomyces albus]
MTDPRTRSGQPGRTFTGRMSYPIRLSFALWLIAEFALVVLAVWGLGVGWTIVLFLGTSVLGVILINIWGMKSLRTLQEAYRLGKDPRSHMPSGFATVGSILLIVPGFVTDLLGLLLILPPTRFLFKKLALYISAMLPSPATIINRNRSGRDTPLGEDIIDGEVLNDDPPIRKPAEDPRRIEGEDPPKN